MSEVNRWGLGILLMLLVYEVGVDVEMVPLFLRAVVAAIGFVLFTHEKKAGQEDGNESD